MNTYGEVWITQHWDRDGKPAVTIDRADPVVTIAPEVLAGIAAAPPGWPATFDGQVLRIYGTNRTVIYRIREEMEPMPGSGALTYVGEWPD